MSAALGISFGRDRVYLAQLSRDGDAVKLHAATSAAIPNPTSGAAIIPRVADALRSAMAAMPVPPAFAAVALPASWTFAFTFHAAENISNAQLQARSKWEIAQHCGDDAIEEHAAMIVPLLRDAPQFLAVAYPKHFLERLHELFFALGCTLCSTALDAMCAQRALLLNYADITGATAMIVHCSDYAGSLALVNGEKIIAFKEVELFANANEIIRTIEQLENNAGVHAQEIFLCGESLSKNILDDVVAGKPLRRVRRLNAFRNIVPHTLDARAIAYCKRTAHLFPSAIGAGLLALETMEEKIIAQ